MKPLCTLLDTQQQQLTQMLSLLEEEFALLEQRRALSLPALTERKQALLEQIQAVDAQIATQPNLAQQLAAHQTKMDAITEQLSACQERNEINGRLLELNITANRRLSGMLAQLRDRNSLTYDARGNTRSGTRSLGIKA